MILGKTNICLYEKLKLNEWKKTSDVSNWFTKFDEKHLHTFTIFDVKDFYPSIKETLLKNTIQFAQEHADLNKNNFLSNISCTKVFFIPFKSTLD